MHATHAVSVTRIIGVDGTVTKVRCAVRPDGSLAGVTIRHTDSGGVVRKFYAAAVPPRLDRLDCAVLVAQVLKALRPDPCETVRPEELRREYPQLFTVAGPGGGCPPPDDNGAAVPFT